MKCNNCLKDNLETSELCAFCSYRLNTLANEQKDEKTSFMKFKNILPMIIITLFILLSVFLTKDFVYDDSSTKNIDLNQKYKIENLKKTKFKDFEINIPSGYEVIKDSSYLLMTNQETNVRIVLSFHEASYSLLRKNQDIMKENYDRKSYKLKSIEIKNNEFEHILLTAINNKDKEIYEIYAKYDNEHIWYIIVDNLYYKTVAESKIADALLLVLGVSR